jgi:hypothetical protein
MRCASTTSVPAWFHLPAVIGDHKRQFRLAIADGQPTSQLELVEGKVLGGGAFSRVSKVVEESNERAYALKRMRKATVLQCPEHVFCEQVITRNTAHPFCIRQVRPAIKPAHAACETCDSLFAGCGWLVLMSSWCAVCVVSRQAPPVLLV